LVEGENDGLVERVQSDLSVGIDSIRPPMVGQSSAPEPLSVYSHRGEVRVCRKSCPWQAKARTRHLTDNTR